MRFIIYYFFKVFVKTGLFFYSKKIKVSGKNNIPKEGAVLFTSNHPNGLIDPLIIATHIKRKTHFLVQAGVFKNKSVANFFDLLGMMPIYRIRDGIKQLSKNEEIFNKCQKLLKNNKTLLIFPEGSHDRKRTIRPLSKGFTRIIFGTLNNYPDTKIFIVPVGITYQNSSKYPSKVAVNFGEPILSNDFYNKDNLNNSIKILKEKISTQLENLIVHIRDDEYYASTLEKLNKAQVDFTEVKKVNNILKIQEFPNKKQFSKNHKNPLFYLVILNSLLPYLLWKKLSKKVNEIEFIDTFRFGINMILFPLFYIFQTSIIYLLFNKKIALSYFIFSFLLVLLFTKTSVNKTESSI
ncbi:lysophospholipid acyltransferase family protein [uncultured Tenacibaculum sp.]|uniref:lysophospholipid acyltransferase family protein n=1 Tax=uncultured Tenacibaculum sp. TaxID=174713 RepID=UPI0026395F1F|nr:lysophospholipid acyltransferase family protein [uncultured Tenacibaculum sp.]